MHATPSSPAARRPAGETIIEAGGSGSMCWRDIWHYRELFLTLAWRDLAVRYKQTLVGVAWAAIRPLLTMVILTVVFGRVAGLPGPEGIPYPLLVLAGMLPWQFFSSALSDAAESVVGNANLVAKVYFPRIILPTATVLVALADFTITAFILGAVMAWTGHVPGWRVLLLPLFALLALLSSLGPGIWLTALNVRFRDFRYVIPFIVQFGLYISPVGFASTSARQALGPVASSLYDLNPLVGIIDGFRWCLLGEAAPIHPPALVSSIAVSSLLLLAGLRQFRRTERSLADII